jgi:nucleoside 2-deoxyribosyltransferase
MLIYVAGKYTGNVDENIAAARTVAIALWEKGHAVICPHLNSAHMEQDCKATWEDYLKGDFNMISRCDALVMVENWKDSKGAQMEHEYALSLGIPIYYAPDLPELHRTETTSPVQCQAFRETLGKMYRTHLSKNADYSPANIILTGETGLVTRLWDQTARLLNLTGFKFKYLMCEGIDPPKNPKHESIDDTYQDMAVYAVIGMLLRKGQWGR